MPRKPFFKFYPADWMGDPGLAMCSLAARGLWIEMLCVMDQSDPRGWLNIGGHFLSTDEFCQKFSGRVNEAQDAARELAKFKVFSVQDSKVFSRRMIRESHISDVRSFAVSKREQKKSFDGLLMHQNGIKSVTIASNSNSSSSSREEKEGTGEKGKGFPNCYEAGELAAGHPEGTADGSTLSVEADMLAREFRLRSTMGTLHKASQAFLAYLTQGRTSAELREAIKGVRQGQWPEELFPVPKATRSLADEAAVIMKERQREMASWKKR